MHTLKSSVFTVAFSVVAGAGLAQSSPTIEELSNGNISITMSGCNVLYDRSGRVLTQERNCTRADLGLATRTMREFLRNASESHGGSAGISVITVEYGAGDRLCDATRAVADACSGQERCSLPIDNDLCGDPARGTRKTAELIYSCGDAQYRESVAEGETARLACPDQSDSTSHRPGRPESSRPGRPDFATSRPSRPSNGRISMDQVDYGAGNDICDATPAFRGPCAGREECQVLIDNDLCGDPARGTRKSAEIAYHCGRRDYRLSVAEGETAALTCSDERDSFRPGNTNDGHLYIDTVDYGSDDRSCDATDPFDETCSGRSNCVVRVDNDLCGDPAQGTRKTAEIYYQCNGRSYQKTVAEGDSAALQCP